MIQWLMLRRWVHINGAYESDWGSPRFEPYEDGTEFAMEEQLNFANNIQAPRPGGVQHRSPGVRVTLCKLYVQRSRVMM